jgi:hypothetical protein
MIRLLTALFLGIGIFCFSNDMQQADPEWPRESLLFLAYGNESLLLNQPSYALENYQEAREILHASDGFFPAIDFLISFGEAIAYDLLGCHEQCQQSLDELLVIYDENDDEEEEEEDSESDEYTSFCCIEVMKYLRTLAYKAPSPDVRKFLLSLINGMEEELLFGFGDLKQHVKLSWLASRA